MMFTCKNCGTETMDDLYIVCDDCRLNKSNKQPIPADILNTAKLLHTQDNRITDQPMFLVQEKKKIHGYDPDYADAYEWYNPDDNSVADEIDTERLEELTNLDIDTAHWRKAYYNEQWEFVTACFTEQGCKDYLAINGHNHRGETRIYAAGSYRNNEFRAVRNLLMSLHTHEAITPPVTASGETCYSTDGEVFDDDLCVEADTYFFNSEIDQETIKTIPLFVGETKEVIPGNLVDGDKLLDDLRTDVYDACGGFSDGWLENVNAEELTELNKLLGPAVNAWFAKFPRHKPGFFQVINVSKTDVDNPFYKGDNHGE